MQFFSWRGGGGVGIWTNQSSKVQTLEGGGGGKLKLQIDKAYHARLISQEKRSKQRNRKWSLGNSFFWFAESQRLKERKYSLFSNGTNTREEFGENNYEMVTFYQRVIHFNPPFQSSLRKWQDSWVCSHACSANAAQPQRQQATRPEVWSSLSLSSMSWFIFDALEIYGSRLNFKRGIYIHIPLNNDHKCLPEKNPQIYKILPL